MDLWNYKWRLCILIGFAGATADLFLSVGESREAAVFTGALALRVLVSLIVVLFIGFMAGLEHAENSDGP